MVATQRFLMFTPIWGRCPIWLIHIFQRGWNHQLRSITMYLVGPPPCADFVPPPAGLFLSLQDAHVHCWMPQMTPIRRRWRVYSQWIVSGITMDYPNSWDWKTYMLYVTIPYLSIIKKLQYKKLYTYNIKQLVHWLLWIWVENVYSSWKCW